jgi:hypothetical protein
VVASLPKQAAAPKPTAPAQPAPAIIPKPAKPFVPTTFEAPKQQQEPNFRYAAPIEDRAIGNTLFNRMLDAQITVTAREILATAPEVRKSFKDVITTRKVPTSANPAKAYVDTNTQSARGRMHPRQQVANSLHLRSSLANAQLRTEPPLENHHAVHQWLTQREPRPR